MFSSSSKPKDDEESAPLLHDDSQLVADTESGTPHAKPCYGSAPMGDTTISEHSVHDEEEEKKLGGNEAGKGSSRIAYVRRFALFLPYLWPSNKRQLQLNLVGIFICLALIRVLKVLAPFQLGIVINLLGTSSGDFPLRQIILYLFFNWVDSVGLIETAKAYLWIPVEQNAQKSLFMVAYNRVMMLSSDFHDNKKSGELYKAIEQGTSIHTLMEQVLFDVAPMMFDLVVACGYLSYLFGWYMSLVVCTVSVSYVWVAKRYTEKQVPVLTAHTEAIRAENQILYDTVGSWISVNYFNNFGYEEKRYCKAVTTTLKTSWALSFLFYIGNLCKESVLGIGYSAACLLAAYQVFMGSKDVGTFVMLLNYWARFTGMCFHLDMDFCSFKQAPWQCLDISNEVCNKTLLKRSNCWSCLRQSRLSKMAQQSLN